MKVCMKRIVLLFVVFGLYIPASTSFADVAPSPFYVEKCTMEKVEQNKGDCSICEAGMGIKKEDGTRVDGCPKVDELKSKGMVKICQARGSSFWKEVWCKNPKGKEIYKEGQLPGLGCSIQEGSNSIGLLMIHLFLLAAFVIRRLKSRAASNA